jgi:hypothetical protein
VKKKRGIEHLHVDAQLVHMAYARIDVEKLSGRFHRAGSLVVAPAPQPDVAVDDPQSVGPGIAGRGRRSRIECKRLESPFALVEVIPGRFGLVYVRIDIYAKHTSSCRPS